MVAHIILKTGYISTRVKTFASYLVAADTVLPSVKIQVPKSGKKYKAMPEIVFEAKDELSGIGTDKNIEIYVDEHYVVPEWDFETNIIKGRLHFKPEQGQHSVNIRVRDKVGNLTEKTIPFFIN